MGRVRNARQLEPEDEGLPGKLYVPVPKVIEINTARPNLSSIVLADQIHNVDEEINRIRFNRETPIRLKSTDQLTTDKFNKPEKVMYALPQRPGTQHDVKRYHEQQRINGFGEGCVVARRWAALWRQTWHGYWGRIVRINEHVPIQPYALFAPFAVKWFNIEGEPEPAWAEDLVLIHPFIDKSIINDILEAQGVSTEVL